MRNLLSSLKIKSEQKNMKKFLLIIISFVLYNCDPKVILDMENNPPINNPPWGASRVVVGCSYAGGFFNTTNTTKTSTFNYINTSNNQIFPSIIKEAGCKWWLLEDVNAVFDIYPTSTGLPISYNITINGDYANPSFIGGIIISGQLNVHLWREYNGNIYKKCNYFFANPNKSTCL